jgi:antitoxin (DNA-binding transcriptional repressor) of toxin-antitoxin stability system
VRTIQASKFKATCLQLMDEIAASGERVVITKHGKPISLLSPYSAKPETLFGLHSGSIKILGDLVEPIDEPWNAET